MSLSFAVRARLVREQVAKDGTVLKREPVTDSGRGSAIGEKLVAGGEIRSRQ
jgi:hypothetical protein